MCLFSIKFEGRTYNKGATLLLLKYQRDEIERLKEELNDFPARNKSGKFTKRVNTETKNQNKE